MAWEEDIRKMFTYHTCSDKPFQERNGKFCRTLFMRRKNRTLFPQQTQIHAIYTQFVHKVKAQDRLISDLTSFELPRVLDNPNRSEDIWRSEHKPIPVFQVIFFTLDFL